MAVSGETSFSAGFFSFGGTLRHESFGKQLIDLGADRYESSPVGNCSRYCREPRRGN
jgi:hypothetical protein